MEITPTVSAKAANTAPHRNPKCDGRVQPGDRLDRTAGADSGVVSRLHGRLLVLMVVALIGRATRLSLRKVKLGAAAPVAHRMVSGPSRSMS
jgi:hypothetical protein